MFSFSKYRGKEDVRFSRKLPHVHGSNVMKSELLTRPDLFNGLELIFDANFINLLQGILYDSEGSSKFTWHIINNVKETENT